MCMEEVRRFETPPLHAPLCDRRCGEGCDRGGKKTFIGPTYMFKTSKV